MSRGWRGAPGGGGTTAEAFSGHRVKPLLTITAARVGRWHSCQASIIATNGSTLLPIASGRVPTSRNLGLYSLSRSYLRISKKFTDDAEFTIPSILRLIDYCYKVNELKKFVCAYVILVNRLS